MVDPGTTCMLWNLSPCILKTKCNDLIYFFFAVVTCGRISAVFTMVSGTKIPNGGVSQSHVMGSGGKIVQTEKASGCL